MAMDQCSQNTKEGEEHQVVEHQVEISKEEHVKLQTRRFQQPNSGPIERQPLTQELTSWDSIVQKP